MTSAPNSGTWTTTTGEDGASKPGGTWKATDHVDTLPRGVTRRLLRKKTRLATVTVIAALSVATLLASLTIEFGADLAKVWNDLDGRKWVFIICAAASAICLFTKEVWTTIARASDVKDQPDLVERFEDHAALCSLIATILGAPVVVAGLVELVVK